MSKYFEDQIREQMGAENLELLKTALEMCVQYSANEPERLLTAWGREGIIEKVLAGLTDIMKKKLPEQLEKNQAFKYVKKDSCNLVRINKDTYNNRIKNESNYYKCLGRYY